MDEQELQAEERWAWTWMGKGFEGLVDRMSELDRRGWRMPRPIFEQMERTVKTLSEMVERQRGRI